MEVNVDFPSEEAKRQRRKVGHEDVDVKDTDAKLARFYAKKIVPPKDNFIEDNIKKISLWHRHADQDRGFRQTLFKQRRDQAIKRREQMYMDKIRQNIFYMNRWNIVREKRKDIEALERQHDRKQLFVFWWIRKMNSIKAIRVVYDEFDKTRNKIYNDYKEKLFAKRIIRRFTRMLKRRAPDITERNLQLVRLSNISMMPFIKDVCEDRSKSIVKDYMQITSMNFDTKKVFNGYHDNVVKLQITWKAICHSNIQRFETLLVMWEKEVAIMTVY
jgi:hypothetical protein